MNEPDSTSDGSGSSALFLATFIPLTTFFGAPRPLPGQKLLHGEQLSRMLAFLTPEEGRIIRPQREVLHFVQRRLSDIPDLQTEGAAENGQHARQVLLRDGVTYVGVVSGAESAQVAGPIGLERDKRPVAVLAC